MPRGDTPGSKHVWVWAGFISFLLVALILGIGFTTNWKFSSGAGGSGSSGTACEVFSIVNGQSGVTLTSVTATYFTPGSSPLAATINAQALTVGTKTDAGVQLVPPFWVEYTSSNNYQYWINVPQPSLSGANTPLSGPSGVSGTVSYAATSLGASYPCVYTLSVNLPVAPASCASATTNCLAAVIYPSGTPTAFNSLFQQLWTVQAEVFTSGGTAGQVVESSYPICPTATTTLPGSCPTSIGLYLIVYVNTTQTVIASSMPGAKPLTNTGLTTFGTTTWLIPMSSSVTGITNTLSNGACGPGLTSSINPCVPAAATFSISGTGGSSGHTLVAMWIVGEQLGSYLSTNGISVPPQATSLAASTGGSAGTPAGFSGLTPTNVGYSAMPSTILFNQYVTSQVLSGT